ncbi:hypothetical protein GIB67_016509 [Kingdonia uniflora]|uniref:Reverse transcriptase zinc-binding domain-containing protein n=1 Tax=Kingdonia uniflora TaxID=39325 RepID=A0A7J7M808_9MAGN|nr:hypothetical protein GIB67_016509 [Kingdonia uniflora]
MYYAKLRSSWEELSHYDSFIEWPASAPSEKVPIPPTAAEIYAKIVEKTWVFQFLAGLNPDFEYARVHLLDRTPFPTLEEAHAYCLSDQSRRSPMPPISGILQRLLLWLFVMLIRHHHQFLHKLHIHHHLAFLRNKRLPVTLAPRERSVIIVVYTRRHPGCQPPTPDCQASSVAPGLPPTIDSPLSSIVPSPTASIPVTTDDDLHVSHSDDDRPIVIRKEKRTDKCLYKPDLQGHFTVKAAYDYIRSKFPIWSKYLWRPSSSPQLSNLAWKIFQKSLPTDDIIQKRAITLVSQCSLCKAELESTQHLFLNCPFSQNVWDWISDVFNLKIYTWSFQ